MSWPRRVPAPRPGSALLRASAILRLTPVFTCVAVIKLLASVFTLLPRSGDTALPPPVVVCGSAWGGTAASVAVRGGCLWVIIPGIRLREHKRRIGGGRLKGGLRGMLQRGVEKLRGVQRHVMLKKVMRRMVSERRVVLLRRLMRRSRLRGGGRELLLW